MDIEIGLERLGSVAIARRKFLITLGSLGVVAAGQLVPPSGASARSTASITAVYILDPEWGADDRACPVPHQGARSCHGCVACHSHALNKFFTSFDRADFTRAHTGCKCLVGSYRIRRGEAVMMFGPPSGSLHRDEFDRRRDRLFLPPAELLEGWGELTEATNSVTAMK